jgi:hypothetical protein
MSASLFNEEQEFTVSYKGTPVKIKLQSFGNDRIYLVHLPGQAPLMITRAKDANSARFWTSVPEGRQKLAEEIGELIAAHIQKSI